MNFSRIPFGSFSLKIYGLFVAIAFLLFIGSFYKTLKKENFSIDFFLHNFWKWSLFGLFCGRIVSVIVNTPMIFERNGLMTFFAFWDGGFCVYGIFAGFAAGMIYHLKRLRVDYWRWIDLSVPSILLGLILLDLGGFLTGQVHGTETQLPWSIQYETFVVDTLNMIHPITIYGMIIHFWLFFWVKKYKNLWKTSPGKLSIRFGMMYFLSEIFLQTMRGDQTIYLFEMRVGFYLSIIGFLTIFIFGHRRKK